VTVLTIVCCYHCQGVGFARSPPIFLKPGDKVEVEIEKIGKLVNNVVAASSL
jgi:2-keto-4-pentenoate hydratase/2-oxohepta-3-ene-1,7-dioic acid hydratase in catechol pathway